MNVPQKIIFFAALAAFGSATFYVLGGVVNIEPLTAKIIGAVIGGVIAARIISLKKDDDTE